MFCTNCGAECNDNEKICQSCGQANEPVEETVQTPDDVNGQEAAFEAPPINAQNGTAAGNAPFAEHNTQNPGYYNPYAANGQANGYQQPQIKKTGSSTGYAIFGFVVACISIAVLLFDYVILSFWTFIMPVLSFASIPKDKRNGKTNFTLAIVFNVITLVIGVICLILYVVAVGQNV